MISHAAASSTKEQEKDESMEWNERRKRALDQYDDFFPLFFPPFASSFNICSVLDGDVDLLLFIFLSEKIL